MHKQFTTLIGAITSFVAYGRTRGNNGTLLANPLDPASAISVKLNTLESVRDNLLTGSFDFEVEENLYRKKWLQREAPLFNAFKAAITAAGLTQPIKAAALARLATLQRRYRAVAHNDVSDDAGHGVIGILRVALSNLNNQVPGPQPAAFVQKRQVVDQEIARLGPIQTGFEVAHSKLESVLQTEAGRFDMAYPSLVGMMTPWSALDARLRALLDHFEAAARASIGLGPGDSSTPGWNDLADSSGSV